MTRFDPLRCLQPARRVLLVFRARAPLALASIALTTGVCGFVARAQPPAAPGVAVQIEKYSGAGTAVDVAGPQFRFQDESGQEFLVSASPDRVFAGVRYGQIEPLEIRIRGAFAGERLEPGMVVAFHATMSGKRVVEPVERLTVVTPGPDRPLGVHEPQDLTEDAIFGLFLGQPMPAATNEIEDQENSADSRRGRSDRDAPVPKVVIGQVTKATGLDRFTVSAGEKIDVGASLADDAALFVDSRSIADLSPGDPVKLEGAKIAEGALFAVKVDVERPVPAELLERPEPAAAADAPSDPPPARSTAAAPAADVEPAAPPAKSGEAASPPAVRGKIVEVN